MGFHRIDIGAVERSFVGVRVVGFYELDELELPHHDEVFPVLFRPGSRCRGDPDGAARVFHGAPRPPGSTHGPPLRVPRRNRPACPGPFFGEVGKIDLFLDFQHVFGQFIGLVDPCKVDGSFCRESPRSSFPAFPILFLGVLVICVTSSRPRCRCSFLSSGAAFRAARRCRTKPGIELEFVSFLRFVDLDMLLHAAHYRGFQMIARPTVSSAISRSATTGFLSSSRSIDSGAPELISRARWAASSTSSNRLGL